MSISRTFLQSRNSLFPTLSRSIIRPVAVQSRNMSNTNIPIENTNISTATGVDLSAQQKTIVGSVLDLFAGRPSLEKLQLWTDEAVFEDPITVARGRKQFEPQWVCDPFDSNPLALGTDTADSMDFSLPSPKSNASTTRSHPLATQSPWS